MREKRTYEEWNSMGFFIMRGEKALQRSAEGKPLFGRGQVKEKRICTNNDEPYGCNSWDEEHMPTW